MQANNNLRAINITINAKSTIGGSIIFRVGPEKFYFSANATHFDAEVRSLDMLTLLHL